MTFVALHRHQAKALRIFKIHIAIKRLLTETPSTQSAQELKN